MADNGTIKLNWMKLLTWALAGILSISLWVARGYMGRVDTLELQNQQMKEDKIKANGELALSLQKIQGELESMRKDNARMDSLIWVELRKQ